MEEKFPDRIDSKFRYVLLSSARAEQMMRGARPMVDPGNAKPTRVAMLEITHDLVDWGYGPTPTLSADVFDEIDAAAAEAEAEAEDAAEAAAESEAGDETEEEVH